MLSRYHPWKTFALGEGILDPRKVELFSEQADVVLSQDRIFTNRGSRTDLCSAVSFLELNQSFQAPH